MVAGRVGFFPSEVSRCASEPIGDSWPGRPQGLLVARAHAGAGVSPEGANWTEQLWYLYLERPSWVLVTETFPDHPEAARHMVSPEQIYRNASLPRPYRRWAFEVRVLIYFSAAQLSH